MRYIFVQKIQFKIENTSDKKFKLVCHSSGPNLIKRLGAYLGA